MDEYIKRSKTLEMLSAAGAYFDTDDAWNAISTASRWIEENIPIADVHPEKHGHWITRYEGLPFCSNCGYNGFGYAATDMNYCPNCGTKMDAKEDGDNS